MFNNYEALKCDICNKAFMGRRPAEGGDILCPECLSADELPVVIDVDNIPDSVRNEFEGGADDGGEDTTKKP